MVIKFCEELLLRLKNRQALIEERLISGNFERFEEYKKFSGISEGLRDAEKILKQLYQDMYDSKISGRGEDESGKYFEFY